MRRFELVEGTASKFWEVEQDGSDLNVRWGRIGTQGQSQTKSFADAAKAASALTRLVNEKTGKGYSETGATAAPAIAATAPATAAPRAAKAPQPAAAAPANAPANAPAPSAVPTPVANADEEAATAFEHIRQALLTGALAPGESLTVTGLRRRAGVSEVGAQLAYAALRDAGMVSRWSTQIAKDAPAAAANPGADCFTAVPVAAADLPHDPSLPPWLAQGAPVRITPQHLALMYASRRFPARLPAHDPAPLWQAFATQLNVDVDEVRSDPALLPALRRMVERLRAQGPAPDRDADLMLLVIALNNHYGHEALFADTVHWLVASHGLEQVVAMLLDAQHIQIASEYDHSTQRHTLRFHGQVDEPFGSRWSAPLGAAEDALRSHLSVADEAVWQACVERIGGHLPHVVACRQPALLLLLPDAPALAHALLLAPGAAAALHESAHWLMTIATDPAACAVAMRLRPNEKFWNHARFAATVLVERGVAALPLLAPGAIVEEAGDALAHIGLPDAVDALARAASSSKHALARLGLAVNRWPEAALVAISRVVAAGGKDAGLLTPTLVQLLRAMGERVVAVEPWIEPAALAVIQRQRALLGGPQETAGHDELPPVLAAAPWRQPRTRQAQAVLDVPLLPVEPVEHWAPGTRDAAMQLGNWQAQRMQECRQQPTRAADEIGFTLRDEELKALNAQAAAAIVARDTAQLVSLWRDMVAVRRRSQYYWFCLYPEYIDALPEGMAAPFWNAIAGETESGSISRMVASHGLAVLPALITMVRSKPTDCMADALHVGAVELALPAARAFARLKTVRDIGRQWLLTYPEHAAAGLLPVAFGKAGELRDSAGAGVRLLAAQGHEAVLREVAARHGRDDVMQALQQVLDDDPLQRYPTRRSKLPEFWAPSGWRRPLLHNGKALGEEAIDLLGEMLTFPTNEEVYAGIGQVIAACRPDSLADFAWDLFGAWLNAGGSGKESWVLTAQGLLGNDDTARRLTPFIRTWPGEAAHARAVLGLDVLATIGTDVALMQINGIAQKIKFKGLQDKAREKIAAIAEARQLTTEELEDRLAPDLDLDEHGTLRLEFGPRAFKVGFDEALKPYVREILASGDGPRLEDLPKPKKSDDPALAKASVERFKTLKKDVRTIASQQVLRLELAMCARRRWTPALYRAFLVEHPLLRHLVQRLVWGVYAVSDGQSHGGTLQACFRVAEDGSFTDANDDPFDLPEGEAVRIGVPHALELSAADAAAFGQVLADYELLQPFAQIGRDTYTLRADEHPQDKLLRWKGAKVPTGRVLGLVNKGWRRGMAQDGGGIWYFTKPLANGKVIELLLDPGIIVGMVNEYPEQELGDVQFGSPGAWGDMQQADPLSALDPIAASELIRDLEALRA
ncbi:DUF4132 domain-containing protein [Stenotrophomonas rhizophila]